LEKRHRRLARVGLQMLDLLTRSPQSITAIESLNCREHQANPKNFDHFGHIRLNQRILVGRSN
jgi:hypothetical protein